MTLEEIQKANEVADAARQAQATAETTVVPAAQENATVSADKTPEQLAQEAEVAAEKVRQDAVVTSVKGLIDTLASDPLEFSVAELGWATDAFKTCLQIRVTATKEHNEFAQVNSDAQKKFYALKLKDLTSIYEVDPAKTEAVAESSSPSNV